MSGNPMTILHIKSQPIPGKIRIIAAKYLYRLRFLL